MMLKQQQARFQRSSINGQASDTRKDSQSLGSSSGQRLGEAVKRRDSPSVDAEDISGSNKTFPETLRAILSDPDQKAIQWLDHGKAFIIRDRSEFIERVLPKFLGKATKYTSFTRKLSRWKFQRTQCGPEEGAWYNEKFTRDSDDELKDMKCAKRKKTTVGRSPSKKKTVTKPTVRKHPLPTRKLTKRSMPLKKRPVDASLFELMKPEAMTSSCRRSSRLVQPPASPGSHTSPPPYTPYGTDTTTQSIVNAAVKALASANSSPTTLLPNHGHQGGSGLFHRRAAPSPGVASSLDLLTALRSTPMPAHPATISHRRSHHHPLPRLSLQQLLAQASSVSR